MGKKTYWVWVKGDGPRMAVPCTADCVQGAANGWAWFQDSLFSEEGVHYVDIFVAESDTRPVAEDMDAVQVWATDVRVEVSWSADVGDLKPCEDFKQGEGKR